MKSQRRYSVEAIERSVRAGDDLPLGFGDPVTESLVEASLRD